MKFIIATLFLVFGSMAQAQGEMIGEWSESCYFQSSSGGSVTQLSIDENGEGSLDFRFYADAKCELAFFDGLSHITFSLGEEIEELTEANGFPTYAAELSFMDFRYLLHTPNLARNYRQVNYCGHSDWETGREFDVTGRTCGSRTLPESGHMYYTVIGFLGDDSILLGQPTKEAMGDTPETRATSLVFGKIMGKL